MGTAVASVQLPLFLCRSLCPCRWNESEGCYDSKEWCLFLCPFVSGQPRSSARPQTGEGPGRPGGPPEVNRGAEEGRGSESPEVARLSRGRGRPGQLTPSPTADLQSGPRIRRARSPEWVGRGRLGWEGSTGLSFRGHFKGAAEGPGWGWGWLGAGLSASSEVCVTCWTQAGLEPVETS